MSIKTLVTNLRLIKAGKPINLAKFKQTLDEVGMDSSLLQGMKSHGNKYIVTSIDEGLLHSLNSYENYNGSTRNSAANQNKSHSRRVDGSWVIVRDGKSEFSLVIFDEQGNHEFSSSQYKYAVIVENRQNFLSFDKTFLFLREKCGLSQDILSRCLLIFSDGNEISNYLHKKFLNNFEHLYLFLDIDIGGMQIAANLSELLPKSTMTFVMPGDIASRLNNVLNPISKSELNKALELGNRYALLYPVAKIIRATGRIIEQESYLNE
ncbi:hypothetical protein [Idiomarina abyssalis]|uniref:hypothetical protein n=1 Tax=Idiomarina abyssalis TaxID=86102 RepID=UPI003A93C330